MKLSAKPIKCYKMHFSSLASSLDKIQHDQRLLVSTDSEVAADHRKMLIRPKTRSKHTRLCNTFWPTSSICHRSVIDDEMAVDIRRTHANEAKSKPQTQCELIKERYIMPKVVTFSLSSRSSMRRHSHSFTYRIFYVHQFAMSMHRVRNCKFLVTHEWQLYNVAIFIVRSIDTHTHTHMTHVFVQ